MTTHKRKSNQRTGTITALVLLFAIILTLLGMATLRVSMHERNFAVHSAHIISAKAAADSGLTKAVHDFKTQSGDLSLLDISGEPVLNSTTTYDYTVSKDVSGAYQIESTGHSQGVARTVRATLKLRGLFEYAILAKNRISLMPGCLVQKLILGSKF